MEQAQGSLRLSFWRESKLDAGEETGTTGWSRHPRQPWGAWGLVSGAPVPHIFFDCLVTASARV